MRVVTATSMTVPTPKNTALAWFTSDDSSMRVRNSGGKPFKSSGASALVNEALNLKATMHKMKEKVEYIF